MSTKLNKENGMTERRKSGKRTQAERREETREALLAAACPLFGLQGYESTSLEEIAEACGLTIRPIYYHFGSKVGLFSALNALLFVGPRVESPDGFMRRTGFSPDNPGGWPQRTWSGALVQ
jgi:hypothetical protein